MIQELAPNSTLNKKFKANQTDKGIVVETDFDFAVINTAYHKLVSPSHSTMYRISGSIDKNGPAASPHFKTRLPILYRLAFMKPTSWLKLIFYDHSMVRKCCFDLYITCHIPGTRDKKKDLRKTVKPT